MKIAAAALGLLLALPVLAQTPPADAPAAKPAPKGDEAFYALGLAVSQSLELFALSPAELETVVRGVKDGVTKKGKVPFDDKQQALVQDLARTRKEAFDRKQSAAGGEYLTRMAATPGAKKTASGAIVISQKEGTGASPAPTAKVKVNYAGRLVNGTEFDSSYKRGQPAEFPLDGVIKCWTESLQLLKVGGKATVVCPSDIAYGPNGRPPVIPGNAVLTFDIELLEIVK